MTQSGLEHLWQQILTLLTLWDMMALIALGAMWIFLTYIIENPPNARPSMSFLMGSYRRSWFRQMAQRDNRIFDAQILSNLRQSTAFFGSATMISMGAGAAVLGNLDRVQTMAEDFSLAVNSDMLLEIKLLLTIGILLHAFLKFVWYNRLFGYCAVMTAAVPNETDSIDTWRVADRAASLAVTAARAFNRGLRAIYFALASTAWLLGPAALLIAVFVVGLVMLRREFMSQSREAVAQHPSSIALEEHGPDVTKE